MGGLYDEAVIAVVELVVGRQFGLLAAVEQRVQIRPDRFRVPDVCVVAEKPGSPSGQYTVRPA